LIEIDVFNPQCYNQVQHKLIYFLNDL